MPEYRLLVTFDDGRMVRYDVLEDIRTILTFEELETEPGLFENAQLDQSRTCIYWSERIDLPNDAIYEYGIHEVNHLSVAPEDAGI